MKLLYGIVLILGLVDWSLQSDVCDVSGSPTKESQLYEWQDMNTTCYNAILNQIHRELKASLTYLSMGAHFTRDVQFRPGTSAFFLAAAGEERGHARDLIQYLTMRGQEIVREAIRPNTKLDVTVEWVDFDIEKALNKALEVEKDVRTNFKGIIEECEKEKDFHAADLMTGTFLDEQHDSIRKIVGLLATLTKMKKSYGHFSEIMFDKTLLA